jgi:LysR family glycine cleavage system transcriptional activator
LGSGRREDVGQQGKGLNFSDPGLLLDAAAAGWGSRWSVSCWPSGVQNGLLQALSEQTIRGPTGVADHRDSENDPMARCFSEWLINQLGEP